MQADRVVIFGAGGFLGRATVDALAAHPFEVSPLTRSDLDASSPRAATAVLDRIKPIAVINCAVTSGFDATVSYGRLSPINVMLPGTIAQWCADHGVHFVHASAAIVHGLRFASAGPDVPLLLDSTYGRTKSEGDDFIRATKCSHTIIRFGGIFGDDGPSHLGLNRTIAGAMQGVIPTIFGKGSAKRNYIHVKDAANVLARAASGEIAGTVYCGGFETLSIAEMIEQVCAKYLPGERPTYVDGDEVPDAIVHLDPRLGVTAKFRDRL